jgi:hypothetical protein
MVETLAAAAVAVTAAAAVVPVTLNTITNFRINGDAHAIVNHLAVAKMRAAANFTSSRLYVDLNANSFHIEVWRKTGVPGWMVEGGTERLAQGDAFSSGGLTAAPPATQVVLAQAPQCLDDLGNAVANTACVLFNSRGIPIDTTGAATASDALYITGGGGVYGATLSATSRVQLWWTAASTAAWVRKQ